MHVWTAVLGALRESSDTARAEAEMEAEVTAEAVTVEAVTVVEVMVALAAMVVTKAEV